VNKKHAITMPIMRRGDLVSIVFLLRSKIYAIGLLDVWPGESMLKLNVMAAMAG
jgi:hypothetical protein